MMIDDKCEADQGCDRGAEVDQSVKSPSLFNADASRKLYGRQMLIEDIGVCYNPRNCLRNTWKQ